ncbi:spore germination protein [Halalkalibacter lacteus]|uniref:spore germination protein n=1 Tax=Halalkalibacter lacteus TaxID=3090663 RepID=UPI002FC72398
MLKKYQIAKVIQSYKTSKSQENKPLNTIKIEKDLAKNSDHLKNVLGKSTDVKFREIEVNYETPINVFICFLDGLVNEDYINLYMIKPLLEPNFTSTHSVSEDFLTVVEKQILSTSSIQEVRSIDEVIESVLSGETAVFIDGYDSALTVSTEGFEARSVEQPDTESSVRGPREGFNEVLKVNTALIRRKINNPNLVFESMKIGKQTKTNIRIGYINGIANPKIIDEVKQRLKRINTDMILESGYIEQCKL